jgi:hypothetical protein
MKGFANVLNHLSHFNGKDYSMYLTEVKDELNGLYDKYEAKFGHQMRMQRPPQPGPTAGKRKTSWSKAFSSQPSSSGSTVGSVATHGNLSSASASSNLYLGEHLLLLYCMLLVPVLLLFLLLLKSLPTDSETVTQFEDDVIDILVKFALG